MPLTVSATPYSQWEPLEPLLEQLGWTKGSTAQLADMATNSGELVTGPYLLLHTRPELALARAMEEGEDPETALNQWRAGAEQLLAFYKRNNRQAALVEVSGACERPQALIEWLTNNHPAFEGLTPAKLEAELALPAIEPGSLNLLLATQWVSQQQDLSSLLAQLEAASIPLTDTGYQPPTIDVAVLHQHVGKQTATKQAAEQELERLKEENDLILNQLHRVQEELEKYYLNAKELEKLQDLHPQLEQALAEKKQKEQEIQKVSRAQEEALSQKKDLEKEKGQLQAQQKELQEENDLILKQLFKVQEELEKYYLDNQSLKKSQKELQADFKKSKSKIDEKNKKFYKFKAPLRLLRRLAHRLSPKRWHQAKQIKLVRRSDYFDADWYRETYPDVKNKRVDPAKHYVLFGGTEGRDPSPRFSSKSYLNNNPDVAETGDNPLVHYLLHGKSESRKV